MASPRVGVDRLLLGDSFNLGAAYMANSPTLQLAARQSLCNQVEQQKATTWLNCRLPSPRPFSSKA